jgi:hypothetical protein
MKHGWLVAAAVSIIVAGCAAPNAMDRAALAPRAGQLDCPNASAACDVFVGVYCSGDAGTHCVVTVDYSLVEIRPAAGANKVTWRLQPGGGFAFAADGIGIDPNAFSCRANGPFEFACTARGSASAQYKYTVKAVPRQGNRPVDPLDPWVVTK